MSNIGFRIRTDFARPDKELVELFRNAPVANVADCMERIACLASDLRPFNGTAMLGTAFTVRAPEGDNLMLHKALDIAQPGDIIVVAGGGSMDRAYCGEIMVRYAQAKKLGGFIIDGCVRDCDYLSACDFPVYAKGITPNGPYKNGPGEIGFDVALGGKVIHPGDILLGDSDGVVVIDPQFAQKVAADARKIIEKEERQKEDILKNLDRSWIDALLAQKGL